MRGRPFIACGYKWNPILGLGGVHGSSPHSCRLNARIDHDQHVCACDCTATEIGPDSRDAEIARLSAALAKVRELLVGAACDGCALAEEISEALGEGRTQDQGGTTNG